ncbi:PEP/pyruvate-binding domain-containing protein [Nonomuraea sp. NPDC050536]|uniref:PEP/pyruvate-binding domain-containing protein n=1 Tax=Nonomuraea sp. NPDC050536 TaxID=3364366 RepID=UPI0037C85687
MKTALEFSEIDAGMLAEVGGKGANLGELTRAGLPVPPGWVLTTDAYARAAEAAGLDEVIAAHGGQDLARIARERLLGTGIPDEIAAEVRELHARLDVPVAVRSSATAEDLPYASFAGQQDTFLNVVGADAVLDAVRRCWASLWTDRAVAYREANGIDHATVRLAVVVQEMVQAGVAGVMFTANPVTGRCREAVIDAAPGLGEAVVSGAVNPDRFVVDTATREILLRQAGDKRLAIRSVPGGGTERVEAAGEGLSLTDDEVRALAALGARVEDHYGAPQDTEWAIDAEGGLWLTQARPITTLYPLPDKTAGGLRVYLSVNVAQGVMGPITPMGLDSFRVIADGAAGAFGFPRATALRVAGQRLWMDVTPALRATVGRFLLPRLLKLGEARAGVVFERLMDDPRLSVTQTSRLPFVRAASRFARRLHAPSRVFLALTRPRAALAYPRSLDGVLDRWLQVPDTASPAFRLDHAERVLSRTFPLIASVMPIVITGYGLFGLAGRLSGASAEELQTVLRSLPNNPTTEMDLALWDLATRIEPEPFGKPVAELVRLYESGSLPPRAQQGIEAFLREYGHRGVAEIDLGVPRWSERPAHILGVLANYLRLDDPALAPAALFAKGAAEAQATIARLAARGKGPLRRAIIRAALRRTRAYAGLRELPKFYAVKTLAAVRRSLQAVGAHLPLDDPDDVFYLTLPEARSALAEPRPDELRTLVAERKQAYELESRRRHVPRVMLSDGTEPEALSTPAEEGALTGTPASSGTVTAPARVVLDPVGAHLEPGEILVCPSTDPGWTPLFLTAGGLVMEMGGAMSHGAVVAREYGIPAVVGVRDATHRITTGAEITVNGAAGTVTPAD